MPSPDRIGRYRVDKHLGSGAFAVVWLAHDDRLEAPVAVKVMAENWASRMDIRDRFLAEARLLRKASSGGVVQVFDVGETDDERPYFVMEYADRGTVADRVAALGPLPVPEALRITAEAARGASALHEAGAVHRDIKPSNVLLAGGGTGGRERVLVADLGLAKNLAQASGLTVVAGSAGYMAPEQADPFDGIDARADVYGLGAVLHYLVTATVPGPPGRVLPLREIRPTLPAALEAAVTRALSPDRADRWPTATAFAAELDRLAAELGCPEEPGPAEHPAPGDAAAAGGLSGLGRDSVFGGGSDSVSGVGSGSGAGDGLGSGAGSGVGSGAESAAARTSSEAGTEASTGTAAGAASASGGVTGPGTDGGAAAREGAASGAGTDSGTAFPVDSASASGARPGADARSGSGADSGAEPGTGAESGSGAQSVGGAASASGADSGSRAAGRVPGPASESASERGRGPAWGTPEGVGPPAGHADGSGVRGADAAAGSRTAGPPGGPEAASAPGAGGSGAAGSPGPWNVKNASVLESPATRAPASSSSPSEAHAPSWAASVPSPADPDDDTVLVTASRTPGDGGRDGAPSSAAGTASLAGTASAAGTTDSADAAGARRRRGPRVVLAVCAVFAVLAGAGAAGVALVRSGSQEPETVRVRDDSGRISVRVPASWAKQSRGSGWNMASLGLPAERAPGLLVAQDADRWQDLTSGTSGVFVGMGGTEKSGGGLTEKVAGLRHNGCQHGQDRTVRHGDWKGQVRSWSSCASPGHSLEEIGLTSVRPGKPQVYLQIRCDEDCEARTEQVISSLRVTAASGD
ncbi:protein kinase [Streptomyces albus]